MDARHEDRADAAVGPPSPGAERCDGPKSLATADDYRESETTRRANAVLLWSVVAVLIVDVILGTWFYLHSPDLLPRLSLANFVIFGTSAISQLLPKSQRDGLRNKVLSAIRGRLAARSAARILTGLIGALLLASLFMSSVHMQSEGAATAAIHVADGSQSAPDSAAMAAARILDLTQPGGEVVARRVIWPWGRRMWAYTPTHVIRRDRIARAWKPVRWSYPRDFDEQVTVYILPMTPAVMKLRTQQPDFVLRDVSGSELARGKVTGEGARIEFFEAPVDLGRLEPMWITAYRERLRTSDGAADVEHPPPAPEDSAGRAELRRLAEEAAEQLQLIRDRAQEWRKTARLRPTRPLHLGEKVQYELSHNGTTTGPFDLLLDRNPCFLLMDDSFVARCVRHEAP